MYKSNLLTLIKSLTKEEFMGFELFLKSPFFNKRQKCIELYYAIKASYPNLENAPKLKKEVVFVKLFPSRDFTQSSALRELSSDLLTLLEQYIKQIAFEKREIYANLLLLNELNERNQDKRFYTLSKRIKKEQEKQTSRSIRYYYHNFFLNYELFYFEANLKTKNPSTDLYQVLNNFQYYTYLEQLRIYCIMLNRQSIKAGKDFDTKEINSFLAFLKSTDALKIPSIAIYTYMLEILLGDTEKYTPLKILLKKHALPEQELESFLTMLITYLNRQINTGHQEFIPERFDWYYEMFTRGFLLIGAYVSFRHLKNLISLAVQRGDFELAKNVIEEYTPRIEPKYQDTSFHYNMGALLFYQNNFDDAIMHLQKVTYIDAFYHFDSKSLLLKIYYEEQDFEAFFALVNSYQQLVKRNEQVSKRHQEEYLNFIRAAKELYKLKTNPSTLKQDVQEFIDGLKSQKISDPRWIKKKADELFLVTGDK